MIHRSEEIRGCECRDDGPGNLVWRFKAIDSRIDTSGLAGNDTLGGLVGNDSLLGGFDNDSAFVAAGSPASRGDPWPTNET
jgi:hypothetical protein